MQDKASLLKASLLKASLRKEMRARRRDHAAALPAATRALVLMRPPAPLVARLPAGSCIGLYAATPDEAPTLGWARWLHDNGHALALPWFAGRKDAMQFRRWADPYDDDALGPDPFGALQPRGEGPDAPPLVVPDVLIVPLVAFSADGERLGQGAGYYDRWLAAHPATLAIGLAWDCQLVDHLPTEPHDQPLAAIVTPTRIYENPNHAQ